MRLWIAGWMSGEKWDSGGGYESHLQGFVGRGTRGNIVRHTEYRCECY